MKVSFNEMQGLSRKAFSGIGFDEGDANDAADMVVWMEANGLEGIDALRRSLAFILAEDQSRSPELIYQDADLCVVDALNRTALGNASLAIELGYAKCRARGLSVTKIRNCHNRMLIVGYLSRVARRDMSVTAFWRDSHEPLTEILVSFKAGEESPEICMYSLDDIPDDTEPNNGITLIMACFSTGISMMQRVVCTNGRWTTVRRPSRATCKTTARMPSPACAIPTRGFLARSLTKSAASSATENATVAIWCHF